jgi:hypothetical protein
MSCRGGKYEVRNLVEEVSSEVIPQPAHLCALLSPSPRPHRQDGTSPSPAAINTTAKPVSAAVSAAGDGLVSGSVCVGPSVQTGVAACPLARLGSGSHGGRPVQQDALSETTFTGRSAGLAPSPDRSSL